ncbi:hypothetical protein L7F22_000070 [Adiantum nelumboides]|nr:hypothetical protein [Adiantum nelumboides]
MQPSGRPGSPCAPELHLGVVPGPPGRDGRAASRRNGSGDARAAAQRGAGRRELLGHLGGDQLGVQGVVAGVAAAAQRAVAPHEGVEPVEQLGSRISGGQGRNAHGMSPGDEVSVSVRRVDRPADTASRRSARSRCDAAGTGRC